MPVTVVVSKDALTYKDMPGGLNRATLHIYGSIEAVGGRLFTSSRTRCIPIGRIPHRETCRMFTSRNNSRYLRGLQAERRDSRCRERKDRRRRAKTRSASRIPRSSPCRQSCWRTTSCRRRELSCLFVTAIGWKVYRSLEGKFRTGGYLGVVFRDLRLRDRRQHVLPGPQRSRHDQKAGGWTVLDSPQQHKTMLLPTGLRLRWFSSSKVLAKGITNSRFR